MYSILKIVAVPLGWLLSFIYEFVQNYGISIIIFTVIVRLCMYPLYAKQIISSAQMAEIQPKMQEIQKKYKDDKNEMNIRLQELYKEENYNPFGGCLPLLVQMPIILGLFALLQNPMMYIESTEMILAVHESFLWIGDLSQPDLWILPILAAIATYISLVQTQQQQPTSTDPATASMGSMMKVMKYVFPIMIVLMGRSFPAGLTIYWFIGTSVQILLYIRLKKVREKVKQEAEAKRARQ